MTKQESEQYKKKNPEKARRIELAVKKALTQYESTFKKLSQS